MRILLVVYDDDSYIHYFPLGAAYIATVLKKTGHEVIIYSQDQHHYHESHLTNYLNNNEFDVIGVGIIAGYYQYRKLIKISKAIEISDSNAFYILGGHGPSPEPEFFLRKMRANAVIIGEGEDTILELVEHLENKKDLSDVKGIAYIDNNLKFVENPRRELIKDVDSISFPQWDLFPMDYYSLLREPRIYKKERCFTMISGRGCNFKCNFCYRMDKGIRLRSSDSVIEEIQILKKEYNISYIAFMDELLMSSPERVTNLCEEFIKANLNIRWSCLGRLNYANRDVIRIMKKAGCVFIGYGIECFDNQILENMNKKLTTDQIIKGIENTLKEDISPGFNVIFGNIGENEKTLKSSIDFLLKYDDHSQIRNIKPVIPYPGSPLYYYAIEKGLLKDVEDFYENKHLNSDLMAVNFTELSDDKFYNCLLSANKKLLKNYYNNILIKNIEILEDLYIRKNVSFRGFRHP